ncbi:glycoside hydrolase family 18 protein [Apiospora arundinis]
MADEEDSYRVAILGAWQVGKTTLASTLMTKTSFTEALRVWTSLKDELIQQDCKHYNLQELLDELQHVTSESMYLWFPDGHISPYLVGRVQQWIEAKTGESWDWYPLNSYPRHDQQSRWEWEPWNEVVLRWKCNCGDVRWAIIPDHILLRSFATFSVSGPGNVKSKPGRTAAGQKAASAGGPSHGSGASTNAAGSAGAWPTQPASGSAGPHAGSRLQAAVRQVTAPQSSWVLFLVRRGSNFRLSHLNTSSISCHDFFAALRTTYLGLRGRMRAWFSVWQYSHCDFYMCEKFEEDEVAPRKRDSFPDASDPFYQFTPRPMDRIPPISRHEFYRRFHTCLETTKKYHVHHMCKVMRGHTRGVLHLLPQRTQELELGGDKRELFWGLYAREAVSLQRVLAYNAVCLFPVLGFFFAWLFGGFGSASDLQNASVPIGLMASLLSLFWSLFLSSLQFGRSN